MRTQVTSTPTQLLMGEHNDDVIITNLGPWTVYVDSISSVSSQFSYAIPAMSSIVWDRHRPMWAVIATDLSVFAVAGIPDDMRSNIVVTKNSNNGQVFGDVSAAIANHRFALTGDSFETFDMVECEAYQTLNVIFVSGWLSGLPATTTDYIDVFIKWYNSSGRELTQDRYRVLPAMSGGYPTITAPVKGSHYQMTVRQTQAGSSTVNYVITVSATTKRMVPRVKYGWGLDANLEDVPSGLSTGTTQHGTTGYYAYASWHADAFPRVHLNGHSNRIQVTLRVGTISVAGELLVLDHTYTAVFGAITIPAVAGNNTYTKEIIVPVSTPVAVVMSVAPTGTTHLAVTWEE